LSLVLIKIIFKDWKLSGCYTVSKRIGWDWKFIKSMDIGVKLSSFISIFFYFLFIVKPNQRNTSKFERLFILVLVPPLLFDSHAEYVIESTQNIWICYYIIILSDFNREGSFLNFIIFELLTFFNFSFFPR
jgi:hypothetical protein